RSGRRNSASTVEKANGSKPGRATNAQPNGGNADLIVKTPGLGHLLPAFLSSPSRDQLPRWTAPPRARWLAWSRATCRPLQAALTGGQTGNRTEREQKQLWESSARAGRSLP